MMRTHRPNSIQILQVLVVTKNDQLLTLLDRVAGTRGSLVSTCMGEKEARIILEQHSIDLILLDCRYSEDIAAFSGWLAARTHPPYQILLYPPADLNLEKAEADDLVLDPFREEELSFRLHLAESRIALAEARASEQSERDAERETLYRTLHTLPVGLLIVRRTDDGILEVNRECCRMFGMDREEILSRSLPILLPDLCRQEGFSLEKREPQNAVFEHIPYTRKNAERERCMDVVIRKIAWREEQHAAVLILQDVSRRYRIQEEEVKRVKRESIRFFAKGAALELLEIAASLEEYTPLIQETTQQTHGPLLRDFLLSLNNLNTSARELSYLALDSKENLPKTPIELRPLLEKILPFALGSASVPYTLSVPESYWLQGDIHQLSIALTHVLSNAVQAMESNGSLQISCKDLLIVPNLPLPLPEGQYIYLSIGDETGSLRLENARALFEPYSKKQHNTRQRHGLAVALSIIQHHGGYLGVASHRGLNNSRNAFFQIYLPSAPTPSPRQTALPRGGRILFMDNDPDTCSSVRRVLEMNGFSVECVRSGQQAVDAYRAGKILGSPFDVVFFDLDVPGGSGGRKAILTLRREYPDIKAIVTTSYLDDVVLSNPLKYGFSSILTKPFRLSKLFSVIERFTHRVAPPSSPEDNLLV